MVGVVRRLRIPTMLQHLLNAHTVVVVLEGERLSFAGHLLELSANCPLIRPTAIVQRIADCIIGNGSAVVRGQLVLPVAVVIGVRNRLNRSSQRASGVSILRLAENIPAAIVVIDPRRIFMRIVDTNQLSQCIIGISCGQVATLLGDDVAAGIVGVLERNSILGNVFHQRRSAVRAVCTVDVSIGAGQLACCIAAFGGSGGDSAEIVVSVGDLLSCAVVLDFGYSVVAVVGVFRGVDFVAGFFGELFEIAEFVILQQRSVENFAVCVSVKKRKRVSLDDRMRCEIPRAAPLLVMIGHFH